MALPILTSTDDVQKVVDYFKTKATGATLDEAKPILGKYVDNRKVNAYITWKILKREGDKFKLDELGRQLSRTSEEGKKVVYSQVIKQVKPYHLCIEWAFHKGYEAITNVEVAAFWHEHMSSQIGSDKEATIKDIAVCFFYVCDAAGLGKLKIGRHGQTTRLLLDKSAIGQYIGETSLESDASLSGIEDGTVAVEDSQENGTIVPQPHELQESRPIASTPLHETPIKIFISHSDNMDMVEQIKTMLELAGLDYEVAVDEETTAIPIPEKIFTAMRSSTAAVICVTADERQKGSDGKYHINQNVLIEIGAAFVLYDKKVVLVWDKRMEVPSNLQGLYRCEFSGDELSWSTGMKLMKALTNFKTKNPN